MKPSVGIRLRANVRRMLELYHHGRGISLDRLIPYGDGTFVALYTHTYTSDIGGIGGKAIMHTKRVCVFEQGKSKNLRQTSDMIVSITREPIP